MNWLAAGFLFAGLCLLVAAMAFAALGVQPSVQALAIIGAVAIVVGLLDWLRHRRDRPGAGSGGLLRGPREERAPAAGASRPDATHPSPSQEVR